MTIQRSIYKESKRKNIENFQVYNNLDKDQYIIEDNPLISIVIPLYNEENSIKQVINKIPNHHRHEIIIVDDGSTDNSIGKVKEIKNNNIKLIIHDKNQGYGAAILTGIQHAKGDIIITLDSDGQHNPKEIPELIKPIINNKADIVIGSRYLGKSSYKVPLHIRIGELVIKHCLWILYRQKVSNNQCGFRAFSGNCLKIFENMIYKDFGFCTELLFRASYEGLKIVEIPITIYKRQHGSSYIKLIRIIKAISSCIILYTMKKLKIKRIIPKLISHKLYPMLLNYLKKVF